ncbi:MAG: hypothetical protein ACT443_10410, partial [Gemmatimonadota bacterium]
MHTGTRHVVDERRVERQIELADAIERPPCTDASCSATAPTFRTSFLNTTMYSSGITMGATLVCGAVIFDAAG